MADEPPPTVVRGPALRVVEGEAAPAVAAPPLVLAAPPPREFHGLELTGASLTVSVGLSGGAIGGFRAIGARPDAATTTAGGGEDGGGATAGGNEAAVKQFVGFSAAVGAINDDYVAPPTHHHHHHGVDGPGTTLGELFGFTERYELPSDSSSSDDEERRPLRAKKRRGGGARRPPQADGEDSFTTLSRAKLPGVTLISDYGSKSEWQIPQATYKRRFKSKLFWAIFNLWNDVLSPASVSIPFYMFQAGVYLTPALFIITGIISVFTLYLVYHEARKHKVRNFGELSEKALGKPGLVLSIFFMFIFNYGSFLFNLMIMGSNLPPVLTTIFGHSYWFFSRESVLVVSTLIFLPLAFMKNIANYAFLSFLSMVGIFLLIAMVLVRALIPGEVNHAPPTQDAFAFWQPGMFQAAGAISFIYVCQDLSISVYESLRNPTPIRWMTVIMAVMGLTTLICVVYGFAGYMMFTGNTNANILANFSPSDTGANAARIALAFNVIVSVPYMAFMPRLSMMLLIKMCWSNMSRRTEQYLHWFLTLFVLGSLLGVALVLTNLGLVLTICGAISGTGLAYIMPPLIYLSLEPEPIYHPTKIASLLVLVFGLFAGAMALVTSMTANWFPLPVPMPTQFVPDGGY